jgi:hypothetical protein
MAEDTPATGAKLAGAVFAPTSVQGARRPRIVILLLVVAVGGLIALAALGGTAPTPQSAAVEEATESPAATVVAQAQRSSRPPPRASLHPPGVVLSRRFDPAFPNLIVVEAGQTRTLAIEATRRPSMVAIHSAVFAQQATRAVFILHTLDGEVADSIAMLDPAMLADGRDVRPSWPIAVELAIPTAVASKVLVVEAEVYGADDARIDTIRLQLAPEM